MLLPKRVLKRHGACFTLSMQIRLILRRAYDRRLPNTNARQIVQLFLASAIELRWLLVGIERDERLCSPHISGARRMCSTTVEFPPAARRLAGNLILLQAHLPKPTFFRRKLGKSERFSLTHLD